MIESYGRGKGCRVGLIDAALTQHKPPLNMFKPDPLSKSKIICKLTGDTINKSEEHIWKHINGKRFQKKLEKKKAGKAAANGDVERNPKKSDGLSSTGQKMIKKKQRQDTTGTHSLTNDEIAENSGSEEPDFWVPPVGSRWDFDDGKDRWEVSASETDDISLDEADPEDETIAVDLSARTKRMSVAVGPSSFATRKKKNKTKD
ncbi:unnamed protein product [Spirodela intermedia]|nr:unnamed protein product [Spirodela intermedia]CAA6668028.1 unnamed protein product [Spirodela intermedia]